MDLRNLEKPIMTIQENKPISKISWCTTRNHVLSSLTVNNCMIKLHDIQHGAVSETVFDPIAIERSIERKFYQLNSLLLIYQINFLFVDFF